jgi:lysophospholipase L1-like esterase
MIPCVRALLLSLLALTVFGQNNGNFSLSMKENVFSIAAGTSAASTLQLKVIGAYSQPVYLIPGALPDGISVTIPSPVVGSQEVKLQLRAAVDVKPQTYALSVYAAGAGENHSISFSVTVLPEGTAPSPKPEITPAWVTPVQNSAVDAPAEKAIEQAAKKASADSKLKPADRPEDKSRIGSHWVSSWGSSAVIPSNDSGAYYLTNVTIREIAHLSIGTQTGIRIRLSNALGKDSVSFGAVHVAQWAGDAKTVTSAILPATDQVVTFCGSSTIVIPGGEEVFSDPIPMPLPPGADLAVSIFIPHASNVPATMHQFGNQTSYFSLGDATVSTTLSNAVTDSVRPYLTGIDVDTPGAMAVVALGDSLTDGMLSSRDQNLRWPDDLARRLQDAAADRLAVVNEGIAGNCILINCMGPNITDRFQRDVLSIPGVKYLIVLAGANDIGHAPDLTAAQLADAYRGMVSLAHQNNILVYGATIPPFGGSNYFSAKHEKIRQDINDLIRNGTVFDGVIDFDRALADQKNPTYLRAQYNGDKIRPNDAGYQAMADSIDLGLFNSNPR